MSGEPSNYVIGGLNQRNEDALRELGYSHIDEGFFVKSLRLIIRKEVDTPGLPPTFVYSGHIGLGLKGSHGNPVMKTLGDTLLDRKFEVEQMRIFSEGDTAIFTTDITKECQTPSDYGLSESLTFRHGNVRVVSFILGEFLNHVLAIKEEVKKRGFLDRLDSINQHLGRYHSSESQEDFVSCMRNLRFMDGRETLSRIPLLFRK